MAYKLYFNQSTSRVTIPQWTVAASADFYIDVVFETPATLAIDGILGIVANTSFLATFATGASETKLGGTSLTGPSSAPINQNIFQPSKKYRWVVERISNVCSVTITDITTAGSPVVKQNVTGISFSLGFNFIYIGRTQSFYFNGGTLYSAQLTTAADDRYYDPSASGGAGSSLPDTVSSQNGTLNDFTVPDCWVFYSTGDSLAFAGTLPKLTAAISATVTSGIDATFSGTLPKLTASISADTTIGASASFTGTLPKLTASINATVSTGTDNLSFSGTLPKLTASISATVSAAPNSMSFAGTLPKLRASISATVSLPPPLVAFSGTLPRLRMQVAMTIQVPEPAGDPLALKQALVNARRAEENRNNEYVPPVVIVPEWYIIQQRALGLKQVEVNRARDEE